MKKAIILLALSSVLVFAQQKGSFTDSRDGKTYKTVKIGSQIWMAENLDYQVGNSWCYDNNPTICKTYGRLYDLATALYACPDGWHLPDKVEWEILVDYVGGEYIAGARLKATRGWSTVAGPKFVPGNGTDDYGFSALPGGWYNSGYKDSGNTGVWWILDTSPSILLMGNNTNYLYWFGNNIRLGNPTPPYKGIASVRCVRD